MNQRDFVQGTVRTLGTIQQSRFVRHANNKFHNNSCRELLGEDVSAVAPAIEKFRQVLNHVVKHGAVVHKGISDSAGAKQLRKMVFVVWLRLSSIAITGTSGMSRASRCYGMRGRVGCTSVS